MRILFFGDSIVQGFWDVPYGGWVQRLRAQYDAQTLDNLAGEDLEIFNLGIAGETTAGLAKRMAYEIEARRWLDDPFLLVFGIGLNDTAFIKEELVSNPEAYGEELDVIMSAATHYTDKVLFVGLTPVDEELSNPWAYSSTGMSYSNERILQFEQVLRKICIGKNLPHVQVFETFQDHMAKHNLLADGLHPNDLGHQLIAKLVKPELDKLISPYVYDF